VFPQDPTGWPPRAIHDTVAAIAKRKEFARALGDSLLDRVLRTLGEWYTKFLDLFRGSQPVRFLLWTVVAVLVALVIARIVIGVRETERRRRGLPAHRNSSTDPWGDARRLADSGSYTEAAHALFAALLRACAARGELRIHSSKTTGDYWRELRRRGAQSTLGFGRFRARYDRIIYGDRSCDAAGYAALLADAEPLLDTGTRRAT
jgi:hypothetical protein